jgi:hypothetical protein
MKHLSVLLMAALHLSGAASAQTSVPASLQQKFPGLRVQAKVGTKRDTVKGSFYQQTMYISPSVVVEGAPTQAQGAMEATMIVIAMDTEAKYKERREVYKVLSSETLPIPAVDKATKREFEFKSSKTKFDAYKDASNVGGLVYKWFIFGLRDAETKQLLHFETNCPTLEKFASSNPDARDKSLGYSAGAQFDTNFKK